MRIKDLHDLPKFRDGLSYLYLEHGKIEQSLKAIEFFDQEGRTLVPVASLALLLLGPGTSITHEAIKTLADNGVVTVWVGEAGVRYYAHGVGETRKGYRLLRQAEMVTSPLKRIEVIRQMYQYRFEEKLSPELTLEQIRGKEGARVRKSYSVAAARFGVKWTGRFYTTDGWDWTDPVNRALSTANSCLNGLCHAAIISGGYSPALGFVHTGKQLSFVYDIADLYKMDLTVPLAFKLTAQSTEKLETRIRHACRDLFYQEKLLGSIIDDIDRLLSLPADIEESTNEDDFDADGAIPSGLWSPGQPQDQTRGGVNYADVENEVNAPLVSEHDRPIPSDPVTPAERRRRLTKAVDAPSESTPAIPETPPLPTSPTSGFAASDEVDFWSKE
jgi:CRISPR-associated protein Cas1